MHSGNVCGVIAGRKYLPMDRKQFLADSGRVTLRKEVFDKIFATCALLALAPLMGLIAIAVKMSSPGPVIFKQMRKGRNGHPFMIYKFRTMRAHVAEAGVIRQATRNDPRVTRLGRFLRRTSLDELPQF